VSRGKAEWKIQEAEVGRLGGREVDRYRQMVGRGRLRFADQTSADSVDPSRPRSSDVNPGKQSLSTGARNAVHVFKPTSIENECAHQNRGLSHLDPERMTDARESHLQI
jgi:hypothetical protein